MEFGILEKIGLTKSEIKVYESLLKIGECSITPLLKESGVSRSKVYDVLAKLISKGLVGQVVKEKKRLFRASDPIRILDYLEEQEEKFLNEKQEIKKILPLLRNKSNVKEKQRTLIYEGINGYEAIRKELLSELTEGQELLVIGAPSLANIKYDERLLKFHIEREKEGIGMKIIYNLDAKNFAKARKELRLTQVRFMEQNVITPSWIEIFGKSILIGVISDDYLTCFVIKDEKIANSFKSYFNLLWSIAKR